MIVASVNELFVFVRGDYQPVYSTTEHCSPPQNYTAPPKNPSLHRQNTPSPPQYTINPTHNYLKLLLHRETP